jgi:hypothetical protein
VSQRERELRAGALKLLATQPEQCVLAPNLSLMNALQEEQPFLPPNECAQFDSGSVGGRGGIAQNKELLKSWWGQRERERGRAGAAEGGCEALCCSMPHLCPWPSCQLRTASLMCGQCQPLCCSCEEWWQPQWAGQRLQLLHCCCCAALEWPEAQRTLLHPGHWQ